MTRQEAIKRIVELRAILAENSRRYYVENSPTMSDYDFDLTMKELEALESQYPDLITPDSPTQRVGSDLDRGFEKHPHRYPMLSLANTYNIAEVEAFSQRAAKSLEGVDFSYSCELKFDGTAICLEYQDGVLVRALTRGDGIIGDDVTQNVRQISNIPSRLRGDFPASLEIRGEIVMPYKAFDALNAERIDAMEEPFANPRNAASGSLKLSDPSEVSHRGLYCTLYHIPSESVAFATHDEALRKAASWGLPVSEDRRICHNIEQIEQYISYWDTQRKFLPYATDGIVIKINELSCQRSLSSTSKSPRWAVAYKFQAEKALTRVLSIDYQVGRTGAVTPVANLDPVQLSGTVVKRATLNNADFIASMDIRIGDWVYVEKGGEIIPKITGVELSKRTSDAVAPEFPKVCPDCGAPLYKEESEARWYCSNSDGCPQQIKGRMIHFIGRKAMNILAGDATIDQFYDSGLATTPSDLYDITKYRLLSLEGWQEKSAQNFLDSLDASKSVGFEKVLFALGIRQVGESTAKDLARHFRNIDALSSASLDDLCELSDIGAITAAKIYDFLHKEENIRQIIRLKAAGVQFEIQSDRVQLSDALEGKTIVISGNFSVSRESIKELISLHGGKNSGSISAKTSFLLCGTKPGPEKIKKCEALGIPVFSEEAFRALLPQVEKNDSTTDRTVPKSLKVEEPSLF